MSNARLYAKIMQHLESNTGSQLWDFRTMEIVHPYIATVLQGIIANCDSISSYDKNMIRNRYMPRRLWGYESGVTV
jgi:hypothetical protein